MFTTEPMDNIPELDKRCVREEWTKIVIIESEISKTLKVLKPDKSSGMDMLHPRLFEGS